MRCIIEVVCRSILVLRWPMSRRSSFSRRGTLTSVPISQFAHQLAPICLLRAATPLGNRTFSKRTIARDQLSPSR